VHLAVRQCNSDPLTPPIWLDAAGRPRPTRACWTSGREVAPMRFRASDLRPHGWRPPQTARAAGAQPAERWRTKLKERGGDDRRDDIYAFFVCCHQLTDWIEYDGSAEDSVRKAVRTWP
jgi:hypothetical protein